MSELQEYIIRHVRNDVGKKGTVLDKLKIMSAKGQPKVDESVNVVERVHGAVQVTKLDITMAYVGAVGQRDIYLERLIKHLFRETI